MNFYVEMNMNMWVVDTFLTMTNVTTHMCQRTCVIGTSLGGTMQQKSQALMSSCVTLQLSLTVSFSDPEPQYW